MLHTLAADPEPLSHATLDQCPPTNTRHWVRAMLVEANILPRRDEPIERFETWVNELTAGLPARQSSLIGPYARWAVLRRRAAELAAAATPPVPLILVANGSVPRCDCLITLTSKASRSVT
ncbi:hypothetical protein I553_7049 [Mycobacterium xenopi 4042]|uniref:Uncharacterized protein n=1 Tax=Mycobacterium xenopi 4042 TaxID=1299334 RepID=X7Z3K3_MYCXE|nr:hypothetical protein I553_7049 [Mycobacterium xenopi 4042]